MAQNRRPSCGAVNALSGKVCHFQEDFSCCQLCELFGAGLAGGQQGRGGRDFAERGGGEIGGIGLISVFGGGAKHNTRGACAPPLNSTFGKAGEKSPAFSFPERPNPI
jgi:hypothetical protein